MTAATATDVTSPHPRPEPDILRQVVHDFAEARVRPVAAELDESERFPSELYAEMGRLGLFGVTVDERLGGGGGTCADYTVIMEELSRGYASVADQCGLVELVATLLAERGTPEQRARVLPGLLAGRLRCAYALTEPGAGSDLGQVTTRARRAEGRWLLSGEKIYIHNAPVADVAVVLAVTDPERGKRGGMSVFLVDCAAPGVRRAYTEHKMGQRASPVGGFVFDDVELDEDALLGEEGDGFAAMLRVLDKGRVGIAALSLGISQAALGAAVAHTRTREQFGRPVIEHQAVGFRLADVATETTAARLLVHEAAKRLDDGRPASTHCSMAKLYASEACVRHTAAAVQSLGGAGFIRGYEVERLYRDARITTIYEGTSEMQRLIIARRLAADGGVPR